MQTWIRTFHPAPGAPTRLLCLPHAGAGATAYHALSAALPDGIEALCVQYPGRLDRIGTPCLDSIDALADGVCAELAHPGNGSLPVAVLGHSMGALVGYEVTRRLEAQGQPVAALFASAMQAPSQRSLPFGTPGADFPTDAWILAKMGRLGGTAAELLSNPDVLDFALPALRADFRAIHTYPRQPAAQLRCPVVAVTGDSDPDVTVEDARAWRNETTAPFGLHVLPGGHFYLYDRIEELTGILTRSLLTGPLPAGAHPC
ncbi:thioesterase II family protein [Streptomyces sp. NBC_00076]|uniref:thioesterase II family protein n=1 Tax=Streptomyces sp. NBC_00076 TaxID=2975642 RepID=UPI00324A58B7